MRFLADYRRSYTRFGCAVQLGTLPEAVAAGQLRPLRTLTSWEASLSKLA